MLPALIFTVGVFALICISVLAGARMLGRKHVHWKHAALFSLLVFLIFGFLAVTPLGRVTLGPVDLNTILFLPVWILIGYNFFPRYVRTAAGELILGRDALKLSFASFLITAGFATLLGAIFAASSLR